MNKIFTFLVVVVLLFGLSTQSFGQTWEGATQIGTSKVCNTVIENDTVYYTHYNSSNLGKLYAYETDGTFLYVDSMNLVSASQEYFDIPLACENDTVAYAALYGSNVYVKYSLDGGSTWTTMTPITQYSFSDYDIALDNGNLYLLTTESDSAKLAEVELPASGTSWDTTNQYVLPAPAYWAALAVENDTVHVLSFRETTTGMYYRWRINGTWSSINENDSGTLTDAPWDRSKLILTNDIIGIIYKEDDMDVAGHGIMWLKDKCDSTSYATWLHIEDSYQIDATVYDYENNKILAVYSDSSANKGYSTLFNGSSWESPTEFIGTAPTQGLAIGSDEYSVVAVYNISGSSTWNNLSVFGPYAPTLNSTQWVGSHEQLLVHFTEMGDPYLSTFKLYRKLPGHPSYSTYVYRDSDDDAPLIDDMEEDTTMQDLWDGNEYDFLYGVTATNIFSSVSDTAEIYAKNVAPKPATLSTGVMGNDDPVELIWSYGNNSHDKDSVLIQRNFDGGGYSTVDTVSAADTNWFDPDYVKNRYGDELNYRIYVKDSEGNTSTSSNVVTLDGELGKIIGNNSIDLIPTEYVVEENYPNPFNPSTTIRFGIPEQSNVTLRVFNSLGQVVSELQNGTLEAGYHNRVFNAANLSSGVYLYRINMTSQETNETKVFTGKMLLVK